MILYGNPLSTYCAKVRVVLRAKNIPFTDQSPPDGYGSAAYRAIVPMGTVPGLVDGELVLSESEAIAEYIEEIAPDPSLLPGDAAQRARIRSLSRIHDCWVEPQLRGLYAHVAPAARDDARVADHLAALRRRLQEFADYATPAPYIAGDALTIADCAWPTTLIQMELLLPVFGQALVLPEKLQPWREAIDAHPAVQPGLAPCREAMAAWLQGRLAS